MIFIKKAGNTAPVNDFKRSYSRNFSWLLIFLWPSIFHVKFCCWTLRSIESSFRKYWKLKILFFAMNALMTNSWEQVFPSYSAHTRKAFFDERAKAKSVSVSSVSKPSIVWICLSVVCFLYIGKQIHNKHIVHTRLLLYTRVLFIYLLCLSSISSSHSTCSTVSITYTCGYVKWRKCLLGNSWIVVENVEKQIKSLRHLKN